MWKLLCRHTWVTFALYTIQSCSSDSILIFDSLHITLCTLALPSSILVLSNFMMSESFFMYLDGNLVGSFNLKTWILMFSKFLFVTALIISYILFSLFSLYNLIVRIWTSGTDIIFIIVLTLSLYLFTLRESSSTPQIFYVLFSAHLFLMSNISFWISFLKPCFYFMNVISSLSFLRLSIVFFCSFYCLLLISLVHLF